jgi:hypothetical protein
MAISWRNDVDRVLEDATSRGTSVLLDFNAAPM